LPLPEAYEDDVSRLSKDVLAVLGSSHRFILGDITIPTVNK